MSGSVRLGPTRATSEEAESDAEKSWLRCLQNPVILFLLASLLLRTLFSSDILSVLLLRRRFVFDTFAQLAEHDEVSIMVQNTSSTYLHFTEVRETVRNITAIVIYCTTIKLKYFLLFEKIIQFFTLLQKFPELSSRVLKVSHHEKSSLVTLSHLLTGRAVLLLARDQANAIADHFAPTIPFHVSREGLLPVFENYAIRKTLGTLDDVNQKNVSNHLNEINLATAQVGQQNKRRLQKL